MRRDDKSIRIYKHPAGGWDALGAVAKSLAEQRTVIVGSKTLMRANKPDGFDCPGCAWPDPSHTSSFEYCENGAKAVAWEATSNRVTREFFAAHSLDDLLAQSDYWLESQGRLTEPMAFNATTRHFEPISWDAAFQRIAAALKALESPDEAEFYTSGRASNEAAFLYQLFVRAFGTNNFPDCSNMCHEPTSVGLPRSIGVGKGTVSLDDFDHCDAIFSLGHNPGTNHPRMMATLRSAARRGAKIVVFNPLRERALERFASPQDPLEMATLSSTPIATSYYQVKVGGDVAALKGIMKAVLELDEASVGAGKAPVLDHAFIAEHTAGIEAFIDDLRSTQWHDISRESGLAEAELREAARVYAQARAVIICYGMGITQHRTGTANVRYLLNLLLLRGNIGRPGAGICPLRGHSNVQGDRTVGVTERPDPAFLKSLGSVFGFTPPVQAGHSVVETISAMQSGSSKVLISLGGNFAQAAPDLEATHAGLRNLRLAVGITTKLNRSHLIFGEDSIILPCLGRTELDLQNGVPQFITVEDSMSMVHASLGLNEPASPQLRSEPAIVAGIANATLGPSPVDWLAMVGDYDSIRDKIEAVFPMFADFNVRVRNPGGFKLPNGASERVWNTPSGRANFYVFEGLEEARAFADDTVLRLTTLRSHDQYNTTIYGLDDRYRGIFGRRDILFMNASDLLRLDLKAGQTVTIRTADESHVREVCDLTLVEYNIPPGCCAGYYPELNPLIALADHDGDSFTPAYKSVAVRIVAQSAAEHAPAR